MQPKTYTGGTTGGVGELLRAWRLRRRLSQLDLAYDANISPRHLSFLETGRSRPSRGMVLRLSEQLEVPLRERNHLLSAAGFAPAYPEQTFSDPAMEAARSAVKRVLSAHEPYPALAIDRHWNLLLANAAVPTLLAGAAAFLLDSPVNVLRLSLHPQGIASRILNLRQWRAHLLERLRRQVDATGDPVLASLLGELGDYPLPEPFRDDPPAETTGELAAPLRLATASGALSLISTTMVFGVPADVTLSEIAIEAFHPADSASRAQLQAG